ncbi:MAG: hypothetical protein IKV33_04925 [Alistipes sp.]|nr:hypothetical protein [Alistipes sp.]
MKKYLFVVTNAILDQEYSSHSADGAYLFLNDAVEAMHQSIYCECEDYKELWEDDGEDEEYIEAEYRKWIEKQYVNSDRTEWTFTDSETITECNFKVQIVEAELENPAPKRIFAVLHTRVDGVTNATKVLAAFDSRLKAIKSLEAFLACGIRVEAGTTVSEGYLSPAHDCWQGNDDESIENFLSVEEIECEL